MKTFTNIKQRLLALPDVRIGRELEAKYAAFLQKTKTSREKIERVVRSTAAGAEILPGIDYVEALKRARRAASGGARLRATLGTDPKNVVQTSVDRSFTLMNEHADAAWKNCQEAWQREIDGRLRDWAPLVEVVCQLVPDQGKRLRGTVAALQDAKSKPPETKAAAKKVRGYLDDLGDIIGKLGLKTAFGNFLRAVASSEGASLSDAQIPEVQAAIVQYKLGGAFRVKLS